MPRTGGLRISTPYDAQSGTELDALTAAHTYYHSILAHFAPYVGKRVVEIGAGVGTFSRVLLQQTQASELTLIEPARSLFPILKDRFADEPRVAVVQASAEHLPDSLVADSVALVNVLEHVGDDRECLRRVRRILAPAGTVLILVPALPFLFGTLDEAFGHYRRYTKPSLRQRVLEAGLRLVRLRYFNLPGVVAWFLAGRVLKRRTLRPQDVRFFERWGAPWISRLERRWEPPLGQSLIAIARRDAR